MMMMIMMIDDNDNDDNDGPTSSVKSVDFNTPVLETY